MLGELRRSLRSPKQGGQWLLSGGARQNRVVSSGQASAPRRTAVIWRTPAKLAFLGESTRIQQKRGWEITLAQQKNPSIHLVKK